MRTQTQPMTVRRTATLGQKPDRKTNPAATAIRTIASDRIEKVGAPFERPPADRPAAAARMKANRPVVLSPAAPHFIAPAATRANTAPAPASAHVDMTSSLPRNAKIAASTIPGAPTASQPVRALPAPPQVQPSAAMATPIRISVSSRNTTLLLSAGGFPALFAPSPRGCIRRAAECAGTASVSRGDYSSHHRVTTESKVVFPGLESAPK